MLAYQRNCSQILFSYLQGCETNYICSTKCRSRELIQFTKLQLTWGFQADHFNFRPTKLLNLKLQDAMCVAMALEEDEN